MPRSNIDAETKIKIALEAILKNKTVQELSSQNRISTRTIQRYKMQVLKSFSLSSLPDHIDVEHRIEESADMKNLMTELSDSFWSKQILVIINVIMIIFTALMAKATKDYAESVSTRSPVLTINFLIDSQFDLLQENKIIFTIGDYEKSERNAKFILNITNDWHSAIRGKFSAEFIFIIYDEMDRIYKSNTDNPVKFESREDLEIIQTDTIEVEDISSKLEKGLLDFLIETKKDNVKKVYNDYKMEIKINKKSIEVKQKPKPSCIIRYSKRRDSKEIKLTKI